MPEANLDEVPNEFKELGHELGRGLMNTYNEWTKKYLVGKELRPEHNIALSMALTGFLRGLLENMSPDAQLQALTMLATNITEKSVVMMWAEQIEIEECPECSVKPAPSQKLNS